MITEKEIKNIEKFCKDNWIEITAICKNCHQHWGTLEEWIYIKECEKCNSDLYLEHYFSVEDTMMAFNKFKEKK